jgi:peptide-O-fucosyltransferase
MKEGNPFGPFWDELGVDFDFHEKYNYDYLNQNLWLKNLPASKYPVLAFKGKI